MSHRGHTDGGSGRRGVRVSRRAMLAAVGSGTLAGLAGCSGGDGQGSDDDGNSADGTMGGDDDNAGSTAVEDDADNSVGALCSQLPAESTVAYDAGATPVVCDFDVPAAFSEPFGTGVGPTVHEGRLRSEVSRYAELVLTVHQQTEEFLVKEGSPPDTAVAFEVQFDGEAVPFRPQPQLNAARTEDTAVMNYIGELPATVGDTTLHFPINVRAELDGAESIPDDCRERVADLAAQTARSARVNEETTIAAWIRERWDDPP